MTLNNEELLNDLRKISDYRFPFEKHASVILPDHVFTFGSFQVPAVAIKSGIMPFLEREIHKSTTLTFKDFAVRYEFGEKHDNKVPVHYCALRLVFLQEIKKILAGAGIVPLAIQPAFAGYARLLKTSVAETKHPSVFLHVGHDAVTGGIFNRDGFKALHVVNLGIKDLVSAVQTNSSCTESEAVEMITDEILLLEDPSSDAQAEVETYRQVESVLIDLLQKIYGFLLLFSNDHPEESGFLKIIISGEGTRIKNLDKLIAANLGIPVVNIISEIELLVSELVLPEAETVSTLAPILGNLQLMPWQLGRFDRVIAA